MNVYIAHSSAYDFTKELYEPLQNTFTRPDHHFIFPHALDPINSKTVIAECDLVIAETSYPSTGLGIELGWANASGTPIICIHKVGTEPSSSLNFICDTFYSYSSPSELISCIQKLIASKSSNTSS